MATVAEVNKAFAEKGLYVELPLDPDLTVRGIEIMEKISLPAAVRLLLRVDYVNNEGENVSELVHCEGRVVKERKPSKVACEPLKVNLLPTRSTFAFANEEEALAHIRGAITHLLEDKGYVPEEGTESDLYFTKEGKKFFVNLALRCDETASERTRELIELRRQQGTSHDYALVVPAIQEPLGLPLRLQERWIAQNQERLARQNIGVYGVDNLDPNHIYGFTIYPRSLELKRYFMRASQQWSMVRARYIQHRRKAAEQFAESVTSSTPESAETSQ